MIRFRMLVIEKKSLCFSLSIFFYSYVVLDDLKKCHKHCWCLSRLFQVYLFNTRVKIEGGESFVNIASAHKQLCFSLNWITNNFSPLFFFCWFFLFYYLDSRTFSRVDSRKFLVTFSFLFFLFLAFSYISYSHLRFCKSD